MTSAFKIHVGQNSSISCPELNVNENVMNTSFSERYLRDIITNDGKIHKNILDRVNKA